MITILQLAAKVTADTTMAEERLRGLRGEAERASGGFHGLFGSMSRIAGGILGAQVVMGGLNLIRNQIRDTMQATEQYQLVQAQTNAVLKSTGDASGATAKQISDLADKLSTITPYSRNATQQAENMLLTFTNIKGNLPDVTRTTLDFATAMHMDATSGALQLGKALNDPATGYAKLQREGVTFTKSQVEAMKAMEANGNIAGAQAIMLKELQREFGGSAQAAGNTFAGSIAIAKNQLQDLEIKIGTAVIPVLTKLLQAVMPVVSSLLNGLATVLPGIISAFGDLGGSVGGSGGLLSTFADIWNKDLLPILKQGWQIFQKDLVPILRQLAQIFKTDVVPAIHSVATFMQQHLMPALAKLAEFVKKNVMPVVKTLVEVFTKDVLPAVERIGAKITDKLLPPLEHIMAKILPILNPLFQTLGFLLKNIVGPALGGLIDILSGIATGFDKVLDFLGKVKDAFSHIPEAFHKGFDTVWDIVKAPLNLVIGGINAIIDGLNHIHFKMPGWVPGVGGKGFGIHIDKIPQLAEGGDVTRGGAAIVGERGAELLTLPAGARVTPLGGAGLSGAGAAAAAFAGAGGGAPIIVQLRVDGRRLAEVTVPHIHAVVRHATGARAF